MEKILINNKYFINSDLKIELNNVTEESLHTHDFFEFVYMLKGKSVHIIDGIEYPMNSGDLLIINYNQTHSFNGDQDSRFYNILVKPAFIDKNIEICSDLSDLFKTTNYETFKDIINAECNYVRFSIEEKNRFEYLLSLLDRELINKETGYTIAAHAGLELLLTMIFRKMCKSSIKAENDFNEVLEYIKGNYTENISIKDLSKICHYNPSYFSRIFKEYTGITFSEYLKMLRITKACRLIEEKKTKISEICYGIGYTNKTNFYKHFKEITGLTPLEYKRSK